MSYIVIKTVRGRRYLYEQRTWREGKKVRSESRYLGPADGGVRSPSQRSRRKGIGTRIAELIAANMLSDEERGALAAERFAERVDAYQREQFGETATERQDRERESFLAGLHERYGLTMGARNAAPVETAPATGRTPDAAPPAGEAGAQSPSADGPAADAGAVVSW